MFTNWENVREFKIIYEFLKVFLNFKKYSGILKIFVYFKKYEFKLVGDFFLNMHDSKKCLRMWKTVMDFGEVHKFKKVQVCEKNPGFKKSKRRT